jgi:para-nitrobenzyl esterase
VLLFQTRSFEKDGPMSPRFAALFALAVALVPAVPSRSEDKPVAVQVGNFIRAETDRYFEDFVKAGGIGKFRHERNVTPIDSQTVVRMNRDTVYSMAVFDLDAGPVSITLPDPGKRYMAMQVIDEDHFTVEVVYAPGTHKYDRSRVKTRYLVTLVRTMIDPAKPGDGDIVKALQDAIAVEQPAAGRWEGPAWDSKARDEIRAALEALGKHTDTSTGALFGGRGEVDPVLHLIGTATGWGGNPRSAAIYVGGNVPNPDGTAAYTLTMKDVPVDAFWSVSVYNAMGFFEKNALGRYSLNNLTATADADGAVTVHFGGDPSAPNYIPITPGWNYIVRLYRPRQAILDGAYKVPAAEPAR